MKHDDLTEPLKLKVISSSSSNILEMIVRQNEMILTQNIMIVRNIMNPKYIVEKQKEKQ